jgi:O-antigen ligase
VIYYATGDYNEIERYIGSTPSRGAFHLQDVNAAGSHYILSGLIALGLLGSIGRARWPWFVSLAMLVVALWMSGSRAAAVAAIAMTLVWFGVQARVARGWAFPSVSARQLGVASVVVLALLTGVGRFGSSNADVGSASRSLSIRGEFLDTSVRMFATAPVAGVGIGTYYERSSVFMSPTLRALYGRENAHNYYMQVLAELGVVGLAVFLWWLGSALAPAWRAAVARPATEAFALCLGCAAYLLTCVTGHPFLVVEAAVPFWVALGVAAATEIPTKADARDPLARDARPSG